MTSATTTGEVLFIPAYRFWSLTTIAVDLVALRGRAPAAANRTCPPPGRPRPCYQPAAI